MARKTAAAEAIESLGWFQYKDDSGADANAGSGGKGGGEAMDVVVE